ncbi:hypothetical protein O9K51_06113 [Purpureocillium lavendulum]|uniref:Uncharacterized protein n=1 Tax=Purpureocillium lavendulum TaxID=1247861 RepID=A0AB34FLE0_9HYPO|nr:hypothetical protein O9K51_06113 [Purpureocillium lavendulum]
MTDVSCSSPISVSSTELFFTLFRARPGPAKSVMVPKHPPFLGARSAGQHTSPASPSVSVLASASIRTALDAQRATVIWGIAKRPAWDRTLDVCFIDVKDEKERASLERELRERFACPGISVYHAGTSPYPIRPASFLPLSRPEAWNGLYYIVGVPFDCAGAANAAIDYLQFVKGKKATWLKWQENWSDSMYQKSFRMPVEWGISPPENHSSRA